MGIERFGCDAIAIFPEDATFPPDTFPFQIDGPPTQRGNGTWQFPGPLEDVEIELVVTDFESGDTAVWQVSGIDGDMSLVP